MSSDFQKKYSKYYDLFYEDKNYDLESKYIHKLIKKYKPDAENLLELGCGTGNHASYLSKFYTITAIDRSITMVELANQRKNRSIDFKVSPIKDFKDGKKYDCVYSLFHVINYQNTNKELNSFFEVGAKHLKKNGLFIFDFWYGPSVLSDKPTNRLRKLDTSTESIYRITTPKLIENYNIVEVNFDFIVKNKKSQTCEEFSELHKMRYLFIPEIDNYFDKYNIKTMKYLKWMDLNKEPDLQGWYAIAIGVKS